MTKFHLIRHAKPDWSLAEKKNLRGSQIDFCPLSLEGVEQSKRVASNPAIKNAEIIISSPYTRTLQTATIISCELGLDIIVEYDLHEWTPGYCLDYSLDELFYIVDEFKNENTKLQDVSKNDWETQGHLQKRILEVFNLYLDYEEVIVVSHGIAINSLVRDIKLGCGEITEFRLT